MNAAVAALVGALGAALTQVAMKLLGYEFVTRVLVAAGKAWSDSTQTKKDDWVIAEMAKTLGVPEEALKKLYEESNK